MAPRRWLDAAATGALLLTLLGGMAGLFYWQEYGRRAPPLLALARPHPSEAGEDPRKYWVSPERQSPDGRWELDCGLGGTECPVRARDGSRTITRGLRGSKYWTTASDEVWTPDSRSWVGLMCGDKSLYAVVQTLDQEDPLREVPIGFPRWTVVFPDLMRSDLLGFVGKDRVLARPRQDGWPRNGKRRQVPFYEFSIGAGPANLREYNIALPPGIDGGETALSPDGDWLAWLLEEVPEWGKQAGQLRSVQLAVSRPDGREMRVLGILSRREMGNAHAPQRVVWSPDGPRSASSTSARGGRCPRRSGSPRGEGGGDDPQATAGPLCYGAALPHARLRCRRLPLLARVPEAPELAVGACPG